MAISSGKLRKLFGQCLAFSGLILVSIALVLVFDIDVVYFQSTAEHAEGTVIELNPDYRVEGRGRAAASYPLVRFQVGQRSEEFPGPTTTGQPAYSVGEKVSVIYPQGRPEKARIKSTTPVFRMPLVFLGTGCLFGLLGLGMIRLANREKKACQSSLNAQPN